MEGFHREEEKRKRAQLNQERDFKKPKTQNRITIDQSGKTPELKNEQPNPENEPERKKEIKGGKNDR